MIYKSILSLCILLSSFFNLFAVDTLINDPNPKRFQSEIDTFITWDQKNSYPKDAILFVGSSSIRMWKTNSAFSEYPVINRGFGGAHISDVIHYYDVVLKYKPSMIVFYCGDNDIASGKSVKQVFDDYLQFINKIQKDYTSVKFVFISIKPSKSRWSWWKKMNELNYQVEQFNQQQENLYYVDLATPLLGTDGKPDDNLFLNDKLHLNPEGYEIWGSILSKLLFELYMDP